MEDVLRVPSVDPWAYVYDRYYGLAVYYAALYAKAIKRQECFEDIRNEILYGMVDCTVKYAHLPEDQIVKIIKTVPRNYYGSKLSVKEYQAPRVDMDWVRDVVVIEDVERFEMMYDRYYDLFLDLYFKLGENDPASPERRVLFEILYPSEEFQIFLRERKSIGGISKTVLRDFFRMRKKWTRGYFDQVFSGIRLEIESEETGFRINEKSKGGFNMDKSGILQELAGVKVKHPRAADIIANQSRSDTCFAVVHKGDDPVCQKCTVRVDYQGREMSMKELCEIFTAKLKGLTVPAMKTEPAKTEPPAAPAVPAETTETNSTETKEDEGMAKKLTRKEAVLAVLKRNVKGLTMSAIAEKTGLQKDAPYFEAKLLMADGLVGKIDKVFYLRENEKVALAAAKEAKTAATAKPAKAAAAKPAKAAAAKPAKKEKKLTRKGAVLQVLLRNKKGLEMTDICEKAGLKDIAYFEANQLIAEGLVRKEGKLFMATEQAFVAKANAATAEATPPAPAAPAAEATPAVPQ